MNYSQVDEPTYQFLVMVAMRAIRVVAVFVVSILLLSAQPYLVAGHWKFALALAALASLLSMKLPVLAAILGLVILALSPPGTGEFLLELVR